VLVPEWRQVWKHWSSQLVALAIFIQSFPEMFLTLYALLPTDIQQLLPNRIEIVVGCLVLALGAKLLNQKSLEPKEPVA
jgi:hypothetical protein